MTNEERDLITRFIERVGGPAASGGGFASVPTTTGQGTGGQNLPPIDRDADALLAELFQKHPEARYRITQVAVVQEQALVAATQRISALQAELQRAQQAAPASDGSPWGQQQSGPAPSRGLFGGLFGGSRPTPAPQYAPPPPQYAQPGYGGAPMGGAFQPQGQGFLGGALQTAAGVAGGVLAANALTSLFSGGHGGGGMFGSTASAGETGYLPGGATESSPWGGGSDQAASASDPYDQGGAAKDTPAADQYADNSAWAPAADPGQDSGWQDTSGGDSGWDSGGGGDSGWTELQRVTGSGGPGFDGIPAAGFAFLRELAANNDRRWFMPRKAEYQQTVEASLRALAAASAEALAARKVGLTCDPLKSVFRIHRDVRFSPDKRPHKTHAGAVLSRDGTKGGQGVLYLHIEPANSFAACGFYQPDPVGLAALPTAIVARPDRLERVMAPLRKAGLDLSRSDALRRLPRGFEDAAEPVAGVLRLRHLIVRRDLGEAALGRAAVVASIADLAAACKALLTFGWTVADAVAKP